MANCVLCSQELTFMNASVAKLSDGGKVCRACFKKIIKVNPSINIKRYSLADIKDILQGKEIQNSKIDSIQASKPSWSTSLTIEDDELYEATFLSNDIDRKIRATEIKTDNILHRHFLLQSIISESYRLRKDEHYSNICVKFSEIHLNEFDKIANAFRSEDENGGLPRILVFQNYATLLTELGEYEKAINVCETAISYGLSDGTKGDFQGRIEKIKKKMTK